MSMLNILILVVTSISLSTSVAQDSLGGVKLYSSGDLVPPTKQAQYTCVIRAGVSYQTSKSSKPRLNSSKNFGLIRQTFSNGTYFCEGSMAVLNATVEQFLSSACIEKYESEILKSAAFKQLKKDLELCVLDRKGTHRRGTLTRPDKKEVELLIDVVRTESLKTAPGKDTNY